MFINRPVQVKMIMTPKARKEFETDYLGELQQIRIELDQLEFQNKKLAAEARRKKLDADQINHKFQKEKNDRLARIESLEIRIKEFLKVPDGVELKHSKINSLIEVKLGDNWDELVENAEIILKDGIVVEMRNGSRKIYDI